MRSKNTLALSLHLPLLLSFFASLSVATEICFTSPCQASNTVTDYFPAPATVVPSPKPLTSGVSSTGPLQGGIKSESQLNPSLRLFPSFKGKLTVTAPSVAPCHQYETHIRQNKFAATCTPAAPMVVSQAAQ
jgi:hypothetical protein